MGAAIAFAYKENLFGLKNKIRKLFKAEPEDKLDRDAKIEVVENKDTYDTAPTQPVVEQSFVLTSSVRFKNERLPNELELQRAIHIIIGNKGSCRIPFHYDARIGFLMQKVEDLYEQYEQRIEEEGGEGSLDDFSMLKRSIGFARNGLAGLPELLGLAVKRLSSERKELGDINITKTCSRFVELRMTQILAAITRYQFDRDSPILGDYAKLGSYQQYVAHIDGRILDTLVSYRILFTGCYEERIVFAPGKYGYKSLLVLNEFKIKGKGYIPPLSFMTEYVYPQMLLWFVDEPSAWNFEWKCESVFVKDLNGNYIDQYSEGEVGDSEV